MKGKKRIIAVLLCALTLIGLMPTGAFAAGSEVTIESQTNAAFDYLEYYSEGSWHDLNTPKHTIEQTGEIAYLPSFCLAQSTDALSSSERGIIVSRFLIGCIGVRICGRPSNNRIQAMLKFI